MLDRWKPEERAYIDGEAERQPRGLVSRRLLPWFLSSAE
jgi:hypothetical protein